jgi:hypothetical protein
MGGLRNSLSALGLHCSQHSSARQPSLFGTGRNSTARHLAPGPGFSFSYSLSLIFSLLSFTDKQPLTLLSSLPLFITITSEASHLLQNEDNLRTLSRNTRCEFLSPAIATAYRKASDILPPSVSFFLLHLFISTNLTALLL